MNKDFDRPHFKWFPYFAQDDGGDAAAAAAAAGYGGVGDSGGAPAGTSTVGGFGSFGFGPGAGVTGGSDAAPAGIGTEGGFGYGYGGPGGGVSGTMGGMPASLGFAGTTSNTGGFGGGFGYGGGSPGEGAGGSGYGAPNGLGGSVNFGNAMGTGFGPSYGYGHAPVGVSAPSLSVANKSTMRALTDMLTGAPITSPTGLTADQIANINAVVRAMNAANTSNQTAAAKVYGTQYATMENNLAPWGSSVMMGAPAYGLGPTGTYGFNVAALGGQPPGAASVVAANPSLATPNPANLASPLATPVSMNMSPADVNTFATQSPYAQMYAKLAAGGSVGGGGRWAPPNQVMPIPVGHGGH